jgi:subtilisin-like proprotein convertase family protein
VAALAGAAVVSAALVGLEAPPGEATGGWHTFPGTGLGVIPDAVACAPTPGTPLNVSFNVSGIDLGALADIRVTGLTMTHGFVGDVVARLIAPNGDSQVLFGRTGAVAPAASGDDSNLSGPYTFTDHATPSNGGWWEAAAALSSIGSVPAGDYFATSTGGDPSGGSPVSLTGAFTGVVDPNGTWTLRFTDGCAGAVGSVTAAALEVRAATDTCAREQSDVTAAQAAVTSASGPVTAATTAQVQADQAAASARKAVKKAKKAVRKALRALVAAHGGSSASAAARALTAAQAKLARSRTKLAKARGAADLAALRLIDAQAALTVATAHRDDAQADLAACQKE